MVDLVKMFVIIFGTMIRKFKAINGFVKDLPAIGDRVFEFGEGMTVLFSPNGCGKSVILKCLKAYSGIKNAGWTQLSNAQVLPAGSPSQFPFVYRNFVPAECDCLVDWDGTPSFYNDSEIKVDKFSWFFNAEALAADGLTDVSDKVKELEEHPSAGEYRIKKINKLLNVLKNPPDILNVRGGDHVTNWEKNYIRSLANTKKVTLLIDEPEKALSLPKQLELFNILKTLSKDVQVILATHSPFVLFLDGIDIIDMTEGYAELCFEIFKRCVNRE